MYYRMFATGAAIEGSATIAGYSMNNTAMLLDTRDVLTHRTLVDPHVKVEMGKAGSCEFTILPTHTLYDKLKRMVTFITVEEIDPRINHDIVLFKGRIVELETDLYGQKKVTCEGDLAYLGDSYTPPLASKNTVIAVPRYFEEIITQHNGQVEAAKQFTVGDTSAFSGVEDKFSESSYQNSSRALEDLIEYHGGYLRTRHDRGTTYLDYVKDTATPGRAIPRVEFAKNLVDFTEKVSAEDIFTVLIPLGDKTDTGEGSDANSVPLTLTPPKLNVDDVIQGANAIETFGYILRAETFSGVKDAATLRQRAEAYIRANYNALPEEFTVKAIDLRYLDDDAQVPFEVGENISIVVPVRGASKTLKCLSIQYDLFNPDATEIEVGTGKQEIRQRSLTDQQAQTDAKSRSSAKSAKANTATTEYLTWKDIKAAKELNLTAQKINLLSDSTGGEIVVNQNGQLTFQWDSNKGLKKEVVSAASVANTAKETANNNKEEIVHHSTVMYGTGRTYSQWVADYANLPEKGLLTFFDGRIAAIEGLFDKVVANEVVTWSLGAHASNFDSMTANNLNARTALSVLGPNVSSSNPNGRGLFFVGGGTDKKNDIVGVNASGLYADGIQVGYLSGSTREYYPVVTTQYYPAVTLDGNTLRIGASSAGEDGYTTTPQSVDLSSIVPNVDLSGYAQLNADATFGTVTGSSFVLPGTNSQGQPNTYTFTKHYIKMDDVAKIAVGVDLPYYLGEDDLDLSHTHEIAFVEQKDSSNNPTGKYTLTLKKAVKKKAGTEGETATFNIASTKFFQDAIAGASVYSIAYDGASNTNPAMSVGTKTIPGTSTQVKVLNNVPLLVTYGTDGVTQSTKTYKVSEVELPSVDFQNGSGGTPAISYNANGQPTIDIKAVMGGITVKSKVEYTGSAATISSLAQTANQSITVALDNTQSATNPLAIATIPVTATLSTGATPTGSLQLTMSDLVSMNDVTIGYDSNGVPSVTAKALMGGVTIASNKYTGSAPTLTIARGSGGVSYNSVTGSGGAKEVQITVPVLASTNTGVSTSGNVNAAIGTVSWNTASIANSNGSSTVTAIASLGGVEIGRKQFTGTYATAESDNETIRADGWAAALVALEDNDPPASGTLGFGDSRTVTVYQKSQESDTALTTYLTRTYTAPAKPTINAPTLNTGTINYTTKSVQGGTQFYVQAPIKVTTSVANLGSTGTVDVPIGATVDDATITYDATTGKPTVTANVKVAGVSNAYLATKAFEGDAPTATLSAGTITEKSGILPILAKMGNAQIGSGNFTITMSGSDIGNFAVANEEQTTTIQAKYGNNILAEKVVKAKYTGNAGAYSSMNVTNAAYSSALIAYSRDDEKYFITANQNITLGDGTVDTSHPLTIPWYTTLIKTPTAMGSTVSETGSIALKAKEGSSSTVNQQVEVASDSVGVTLAFKENAGNIGNFTDANTLKTATIQAKVGSTVIAEKDVTATFTGSTGGGTAAFQQYQATNWSQAASSWVDIPAGTQTVTISSTNTLPYKFNMFRVLLNGSVTHNITVQYEGQAAGTYGVGQVSANGEYTASQLGYDYLTGVNVQVASTVTSAATIESAPAGTNSYTPVAFSNTVATKAAPFNLRITDANGYRFIIVTGGSSDTTTHSITTAESGSDISSNSSGTYLDKSGNVVTVNATYEVKLGHNKRFEIKCGTATYYILVAGVS